MKSHVKAIMKAKGMTIRAMMEATGLANKTILGARRNSDDFEMGLAKEDDPTICSCTVGTLSKIAGALGVSAHDLFDDDQVPSEFNLK